MNVYNPTPCILEETVRGVQPIQIEDQLLRSREIFLTQEVNAETASALFKQLLYLDRSEPGEYITLYLNSPGGEVTSGLGLYNLIRMMKSPVHTVCIGLAASMASILFLAGKRRSMFPGTKLMIHDPSFGGASLAGRKPNEIQKPLEDLLATRDVLTSIIAERTGLSPEKVQEMTAFDTFLTAEKSLELGFATDILTKGV